MNRQNIHEYFIDIVKLVATRSTSPHRKVGAVIVMNNRIIATGYNGTPMGFPHESDIGCIREQMKARGEIKSGERYDLCNEVHAEINAIIQCALYGISSCGADIYVSTIPCVQCARVLINAGIKNVYVEIDDIPVNGQKLLEQAGIRVINVSKNEHLVDEFYYDDPSPWP